MENNSTPLISLIIPVYNAEKYLPYLFDDIKKQTFKNFEVIFVNDCSKDNSYFLLMEFKEDMKLFDISITVINHQNNSGSPGVTRNTGLDVAQGRYICFADSDDGLKPEFLETLLYSIQKDDSDLGVVGFNFQYKKQFSKKHNRKIKHTPYYFKDSINSFGDLATFISFKSSISKYNFYAPPIWNKIFKKELIGDIRFENILAEDLKFIGEYISKCRKVGFVKRNLYNYYMDKNRGSLTTSNNEKNTNLNIKFLNDYIKVTTAIIKKYKKNSMDYIYTGAYFFGCLAPALSGYNKLYRSNRNDETYINFKEYLNSLYLCFKKSGYISHKWWYLNIYYKFLNV